MNKDIEARLAALEKDVAAIKRLRMVAANLTAQEAEDEVNGKRMRSSADKSVRAQSDKAVRAREDK